MDSESNLIKDDLFANTGKPILKLVKIKQKKTDLDCSCNYTLPKYLAPNEILFSAGKSTGKV